MAATATTSSPPGGRFAALGIAALAAALLTGAIQLQAFRERTYPPPPIDEDAVYLQSGAAVRRMTGAFAGVAADVYWIRALQYYGGTKRKLMDRPSAPDPPPMLAAPTSGEYASLFPLLDITTSLDPLFNIAYRFGAVFLAEAYPGGPGRPDLAVALLEKGLRARPDKWEYMQDIGFVQYWYTHDYKAAAEWFDKASRLPNAPWWLRSLAATTLAEGGDRQSSRLMWEGIRQSAEIDWLRNDAERRLTQLRALDEIDTLQQRIDMFRDRMGALPANWTAVVRLGLLPGTPVDPTGMPYELTPDGRVRMAPTSSLWPLPEEPQRLMAPPS
jgi:hypothetical protein